MANLSGWKAPAISWRACHCWELMLIRVHRVELRDRRCLSTCWRPESREPRRSGTADAGAVYHWLTHAVHICSHVWRNHPWMATEWGRLSLLMFINTKYFSFAHLSRGCAPLKHTRFFLCLRHDTSFLLPAAVCTQTHNVKCPDLILSFWEHNNFLVGNWYLQKSRWTPFSGHQLLCTLEHQHIYSISTHTHMYIRAYNIIQRLHMLRIHTQSTFTTILISHDITIITRHKADCVWVGRKILEAKGKSRSTTFVQRKKRNFQTAQNGVFPSIAIFAGQLKRNQL